MMPRESPGAIDAASTGVPPGTLRIRLLGGLRVSCDAREVADTDWRLSKARTVVKLLALAPGRQIHREVLIDRLWPDLPPDAADNNLHQALHSARRALASALAYTPQEPVLRLRQGVLSFHPNVSVWVDIEAFTTAAQAATATTDPAEYYAAVEIYDGELLPEDRYEEWAIQERDALQQRFLDLLLRLGQLQESRQELAPAIDVYRRIVTIDPLTEDAHVGLMRLYASTGRRQQALRQFERLRDLLAEELDTEPSDPTRRLYLDILDGRFPRTPTTAPAPVPPERLPVPSTPVASARRESTFVNRVHEPARMRMFLERAIAGEGQVFTIAGEPGIGKTRLAEEFVTLAGERGVAALWGRCYEGNIAPAYWPWVQVIRGWSRDRDPREIATAIGSGAADILRIIPDLRAQLPDVPEPLAGGADEERFRLFAAVADFLRRTTREQPLVMVFDDLHWADRSSLLLLEFLLDEIGDSRVLIIGAYRDVEVSGSHPLTRLLAKLNRSEEDRRIQLRGFAPDDVARMATITSGYPPADALALAIHAQTEGNPLFVREVVRLLVEEGRYEHTDGIESWHFSVPRGVRETIGLRLDRLSDAALRLLNVAAVAGREFHMPVVARAAETTTAQALDLLDEALTAGILDESETEPGWYRFTHGLIQQTLYDEASGARLLRLHRRLGEAIEEVHGIRKDPWLPALAAHFVACAADGSPEKGIHYSVEAGRQATQQVAYGEAVDHFQAALSLLEGSPGVNTAQHIELLLHFAEALRCDGQTSEARVTNLRAAAIARTVGEYELHARAALGIAVNENEVSVDDDAAANTLQLALDLLPGEATITRASLLASLSWVLMLHDPDSLDRRRQLSEEAVAIARSNGDPTTLSEALYGWMNAFWEPTAIERFLETMEQILHLAIEAGNNRMALIMYSLRFSDLLVLGRIDAAEAELAAYKELAIQLRLPYNLWSAAFKEAMLAIMRGRYKEAERLVDETYQIGARVAPMSAEPLYVMQRFALAREHGGLEQLEDMLAGFMDDNLLSARFERCLLALLYCETGRANDARAQVEHIVGDGLATIPGDQFWLGTMTLLTDIYLSLDDLERCRDLYDLLGPYAGQIARSGTSVICVGPVSLALGRLAAALGEPESAIGHLEEAIESSQRIGALPFAAYAQFALADVLRVSGRPEHAARHLDDCRNAARDLGMPRLASLLDADTPHAVRAEMLSGR